VRPCLTPQMASMHLEPDRAFQPTYHRLYKSCRGHLHPKP
jgi:hypothetical protein